jgi:hypothetical protein
MCDSFRGDFATWTQQKLLIFHGSNLKSAMTGVPLVEDEFGPRNLGGRIQSLMEGSYRLYVNLVPC